MKFFRCLAFLIAAASCLLRAAANPPLVAALKPELVHAFSSGVEGFREGVVVGADGNYYGFSSTGGQFGAGSVYRVTPAGVRTLLASFGDPAGPLRGEAPVGLLAFDGVDKLYGVTEAGGRYHEGTIFRISLAGVGETLVDFSGPDGPAPGARPETGLTLGLDGNFYGTAIGDENRNNGSAKVGGTIFRLSTSGRFEVLLRFTGTGGAAPGDQPMSPLLALTDGSGSFIGTTQRGGKSDLGTIFRLTATGVFQSLGAFTGASGTLPGSAPAGRLVQTTLGTVYGVALDQNDNGSSQMGAGHIWQLPPGGSPSVLTPFNDTTQGFPAPGLCLDGSENLVVALGLLSPSTRGGLARVSPAGVLTPLAFFDGTNGDTFVFDPQTGPTPDGLGNFVGTTFHEVYRFDGSFVQRVATTDADAGTGAGTSPASPVFFGPDTTLYLRTERGGQFFSGTIVKQPPAGAPALLAPLPVEFSNFNGNVSTLTLDGSGNVLIVDNGFNNNNTGSILQIDPSGILTTRVSFATFQPTTNLVSPIGGLTPDGLGNFYGTCYATNVGNTPDDLSLFRLTAANTLEPLTRIGQPSDQFSGPLIKVDATHFLGVLSQDQRGGGGLVYQLDASTVTGQVNNFHVFGGVNNPTGTRNPTGPVLPEAGGSFLLLSGVVNHDAGAIVRLGPTGLATRVGTATGAQLHTDQFGNNNELGAVAKDAQGRIYGVLPQGGYGGGGVLFREDLDGTFRLLYEFRADASGNAPGVEPNGGLVRGPDGAIYGVTRRGGANGGGTIFRVATDPIVSGDSQAAADIVAHSVTLAGQLTDNGFGGEYWFTYGLTGGPLDQTTPHQTFDGFHGMQDLKLAVGGLQGHHTYDFQFHATAGFGASVATLDGSTLSFTTPNGAPEAVNDNILIGPTGAAAIGNVLRNDLELDGDDVTIASVTQGTNGSVTVAADGKSLTYTPSAGFLAATKDTFTYTITDNYAGGALTSTATVNVLLDTTITGAYAGLLFDAQPAPVAAGFATFTLTAQRMFTARLEVGGKVIVLKGTLSPDHDTEVGINVGAGHLPAERSSVRSNVGTPVTGAFRLTPNGAEGRLTVGGRPLILSAGQGVPVPKSDFTLRLTPTETADPVGAEGLPAGSGFAMIRQSTSARATLVGELPDGTHFSKGSIVAPILLPDGLTPSGDRKLVFQLNLYASKTGSLDDQLLLTAADEVKSVAGTTMNWNKTPQKRDKRFAHGFVTNLDVVGGKYTQPPKDQTPLLAVGANGLLASFERGGVFEPVSTRFTFAGTSAKLDKAAVNTARATVTFIRPSGLILGTFKPSKTTLQYRGIVLQADQTCAGYFLGTADAGSVQMTLVP